MTTLNNLVDKIFIINLESRPDKYNDITKALDNLKITNYERFNAIKPSLDEIYKSKPLVTLYNKTYYGKGVVGCKLSHIEVIKIARDRGYKQILILEDDAKPIDNFETILNNVISELTTIDDKWSFLYLSANHKEKGVPLSGHIKQCKTAYTTAAYIVRSNVFEEIITEACTHVKEIDTYYVDIIQKSHTCLGTFPNLFTQKAYISDISNHYTDYDLNQC